MWCAAELGQAGLNADTSVVPWVLSPRVRVAEETKGRDSPEQPLSAGGDRPQPWELKKSERDGEE